MTLRVPWDLSVRSALGATDRVRGSGVQGLGPLGFRGLGFRALGFRGLGFRDSPRDFCRQ